MDRDAGRNSQQVLVIAGKVGQPGISIVGLDYAEGEMLAVLIINPNAHQQGKGISRRLNESCLVGKSRIKAVGKTRQPLYERLDVVVSISSVFPLLTKP